MRDQFPLAVRFVALAEHLGAAGSVGEVLSRLVSAAVDLIDGADLASVSLLAGSRLSTPACTEPLARTVDELQYATGEGPSLLAVRERGLPYVEAADLAVQSRWPAFGPQAAARGVRAVLCLGLFPGATEGPAGLGTLNLYGYHPHAFDPNARDVGLLLAAHAAVAMACVRQASQLKDALRSRDMIGQAKGILMERRNLTAEQALDVLRRTSQRLNMKLRDVAARIADTGVEPPVS